MKYIKYFEDKQKSEITRDKLNFNDVVDNFEYGGPKGEAITDYVELTIDPVGVNRLERNLNDDCDEIDCIVHFIPQTKKVHDINFNVVSGKDNSRCNYQDDEILVELTPEEKKTITEFAWEALAEFYQKRREERFDL